MISDGSSQRAVLLALFNFPSTEVQVCVCLRNNSSFSGNDCWTDCLGMHVSVSALRQTNSFAVRKVGRSLTDSKTKLLVIAFYYFTTVDDYLFI